MWKMSQSKKMLWISSLALSFAILFSYVKIYSSKSDQSNYAKIQEWLLDTSQEKTNDMLSLLRNTRIQPILQAKASQKLLLQGNTTYSEEFLRKNNTKLANFFPFYQSFSNTSVKIAEGNLKKALEEALSLKTEMASKIANQDGPHSLYVFNLYRIGVLCKKLDDSQGEQAAWTELDMLLQSSNPLLKNAGLSLVNAFSFKELSLTDYCTKRKAALSASL